jgi:hypothetical protein
MHHLQDKAQEQFPFEWIAGGQFFPNSIDDPLQFHRLQIVQLKGAKSLMQKKRKPIQFPLEHLRQKIPPEQDQNPDRTCKMLSADTC